MQGYEQVSMQDLAERVFGEEDAEYRAFTEKFKPKRTTDDCYTPENIYDVVAEWVEREYGVRRTDFVRPFYPGGDYEHTDYPDGCAVVDNPPFSILSKIIGFYVQHKIRFFLFAPALTVLECVKTRAATAICAYVQLTYENGAKVNTSFVTNMDACQARTAPDLSAALKRANDENARKMHKELPKYVYPDHVLTSYKLGKWSRYGVDFRIGAGECSFCRTIDAQRQGKSLYGGGLLISESKAAEARAAEARAAEAKAEAAKAKHEFQLSGREWEIIRGLK